MDRSEADHPRFDRVCFGGSFDPIHRGHLSILAYLLENEYASFIDLVPAAVSPFKTDTPPADAVHRLAMIELALSNLDESIRAKIDTLDLELKRPPPSYTIETLSWLKKSHPGERIGLVIGSDSLNGFTRWKNAARMLREHVLLVFRRPGEDHTLVEKSALGITNSLHAPPDQFIFLDNPPVDCASREIRKAIRSGMPDEKISVCLTHSVLDYIRRKGLYLERD